MRIDLRSDTVTLPSPAMLSAAIAAPLGDDVYGEDPTVARLEASVAALLGMEAGLFVPSGTMGNLCVILTHCARGTRVVCGAESHIFRYEAAGASALGGVAYHPLSIEADGGFELRALDDALDSPDDPHVAPAGLVAIENTHARSGGVALGVERTRAIIAVARRRGVRVHVDGARLFNAAAALRVAPQALVAGADSVQICLSKGLGAPAGSVLAGSRDLVAQARRVRKMLGGGMRQAGVLAAMGLEALANAARLEDDHARASRLAGLLRDLAGEWLDVASPETSFVMLAMRAPDGDGAARNDAFVVAAARRGVLIGKLGARVRAVTHLDIDDAAVELAGRALSESAAEVARSRLVRHTSAGEGFLAP